MFESIDNTQLDNILKVCSKALTRLSAVLEDNYNDISSYKKTIIARVGTNFIANQIKKNITQLIKDPDFSKDGLGYVCDEFFVSRISEQPEYFVKAVKPWQSIGIHKNSYDSIILYAWGVYNSKTNERINRYILEERQQAKESIYLFRIFNVGEVEHPDSIRIYGTELPIDVYYSTKLVLIHTLNGKGNLAKFKIRDNGYMMIVVSDEDKDKIKAEQADYNKTMDEKHNDL
jgi:hypothetical protein